MAVEVVVRFYVWRDLRLESGEKGGRVEARDGERGFVFDGRSSVVVAVGVGV